MQSVQEIFGRYVLIELLDAGPTESWLGVALDAAEPDAHVVVRRVPLWVHSRHEPVQMLRREAEARALGSDPSLPRMVDHGRVGDMPFVAYAYVPGVTLETLLDAVRRADVEPLAAPCGMVLFITLLNAMHALAPRDPLGPRRIWLHPRRIVLPWDGLPVLVGPGTTSPPAQSGLAGAANAVLQALTGQPPHALSGQPVQLGHLAPRLPRPLVETLAACLDGRLTEADLPRVARGVESLLADHTWDAADDLQACVCRQFMRERATWEARRLVHGRLRRRIRRDDQTPQPASMAHVIQVAFPKGPHQVAHPSYEQVVADVQQDPAAFLRESTSDASVESLVDLPTRVSESARPALGARGHVVRTRDGREMVCIPGGPFAFGAALTPVELATFFMDRHPVTNVDYARFVAQSGHAPPWHWHGGSIPKGLENHPVVLVSHQDAQAFAAWAGKALPLEEQWEKAARGNTGWLYPSGATFDPTTLDTEWRKPFDRRVTRAVGLMTPQSDTPMGVADVGMLWEWTRTPHGHSAAYVVRGGAWRNRVEPPQVINRRFEDHSARDVGFRCMASQQMLGRIRVD